MKKLLLAMLAIMALSRAIYAGQMLSESPAAAFEPPDPC